MIAREGRCRAAQELQRAAQELQRSQCLLSSILIPAQALHGMNHVPSCCDMRCNQGEGHKTPAGRKGGQAAKAEGAGVIYIYTHTHIAQTDAEADKRGQQRRLARASMP